MTGKKDEGCGHDHSDGAVGDELAPMRKWEQGTGSGTYTEGPSHTDRADFREGEEPAKAETTEDGKKTPEG